MTAIGGANKVLELLADPVVQVSPDNKVIPTQSPNCKQVLDQLAELQREKRQLLTKLDAVTEGYANERWQPEYENWRIRINHQKYRIDDCNEAIDKQLQLAAQVCQWHSHPN